MTISLPTQLADAMTSAAAAGKEVAGNLVHGASQAAEHAAEATSTRARGLLRSSGLSRSTRKRGGSRRWQVLLLVTAGAVWAAIALRARFGAHNADEATGRVTEAVGALTDNDDLKSKGKRDQAAASANEAVDKVRDKVSAGIDVVKDSLNKD